MVKAWSLKNKKTTFVGVSDSLFSLQELAENHLLEWKRQSKTNRVIGITGSNGKTTHKEILFELAQSVLGENVLCTSGNFNNHIGVPLTLLRIENKHQVAIIEMGSNHPGEIETLCKIAHPDCGIITNIGDAHIEFFGNKENILKEKSSLYHWVKKEKGGHGE